MTKRPLRPIGSGAVIGVALADSPAVVDDDGRCGERAHEHRCCLRAKHAGFHQDEDGWFWENPDFITRERTPSPSTLAAFRAVQPPAVKRGWARPWCASCAKPVGAINRVMLSDGRVAVVADCHGARQSVVGTAEQLDEIDEWARAFEPGTPAIIILKDQHFAERSRSAAKAELARRAKGRA